MCYGGMYQYHNGSFVTLEFPYQRTIGEMTFQRFSSVSRSKGFTDFLLFAGASEVDVCSGSSAKL